MASCIYETSRVHSNFVSMFTRFTGRPLCSTLSRAIPVGIIIILLVIVSGPA